MIQKQKARRLVREFQKAVENKAFEGTIPWDEEAAIQMHLRIAEDYGRTKAALLNALTGE